MQVQFIVAAFIMQASLLVSLGIFLERLKVRQEQSQKLLRRAEARVTIPDRECGEFVWFDHKHERAHHCVLTGDDHYIHRAANGMGRKTYRVFH